MNVILQGDGKPFGVLEVDSRSDAEFEEHDLAFLQVPPISSAWRSSGSVTSET